MAISVSDSVVIARPVGEVFGFVADHENLPAWTVGVKDPRCCRAAWQPRPRRSTLPEGASCPPRHSPGTS